jgi:DNA-binding CsgD family transcriptional regulator
MRHDMPPGAELVGEARRAEDLAQLFTEASARLRRMLPFDAAVWRAADPVTALVAAPVRTEHIDGKHCTAYWESELLDEDINRFRELARSAGPAASLRMSTDDRPGRSACYRHFMRPLGLGDELRVALRADHKPWALVSLFRERSSQPFSLADIELAEALSTPLGRAVRAHSQIGSVAPASTEPDGPGLLMFDADGALTGYNDEAREWLAQMPRQPFVPNPFAIDLPSWVIGAVAQARAIAAERDHGPARVRVRTRAGRWLVCHASCMRPPDGGTGQTALVIEPATQSDVASIMVAAYHLSSRELEITQLIARGTPTRAIADQLFISTHTVRDHIKAIFGKTAVRSRGALVAKFHSACAARETESLQR